MKCALLSIWFLVATTAHAETAPNVVNGQVYEMTTGGHFSTGGFRSGLNGPNPDLGTALPDSAAEQIRFKRDINAKRAAREPLGGLSEDIAIESSSYTEAEAEAKVLKPRPEVTLEKNTLGWDEKMVDARKILDSGAQVALEQDSNLLPAYMDARNLRMSGDFRAAQDMEDKLNPIRQQLQLQAIEDIKLSDVYTKSIRHMTRDMHLKDPNAPAFSATPPPGTTPAPNNRTAGDSRAPKEAVEKVEAALSESTLQFLQERGIDPREYADAYANGELKDSSGVDEFFATHSNSSPGNIPENGLGEISEATANYRAKIDQLAELYEGAGDDLGTTNSRSRGFSEEDNRAKEVAAYDDSSESLDSDGVSQKEKHALLSFVEEWWTNTTGGKKQKAAGKKNQSRAFSQNESRQKVSPARRGNTPRRTIFDIAGDTYRRNQTS